LAKEGEEATLTFIKNELLKWLFPQSKKTIFCAIIFSKAIV
jgi:hypothetical protein